MIEMIQSLVQLKQGIPQFKQIRSAGAGHELGRKMDDLALERAGIHHQFHHGTRLVLSRPVLWRCHA